MCACRSAQVLAYYLGPFVSAATLAPIAQTLADKCFAEVQVSQSRRGSGRTRSSRRARASQRQGSLPCNSRAVA